MRGVSILLLGLALFSGCALVGENPLDRKRGAIVLVFDTRTEKDVKGLRGMLSEQGARATVFVAGRISRRTAGMILDLQGDGHEVGLSGLQGIEPKQYAPMFGQQKYFQDEIVTQVLDARKQGLNLRYFLLKSVSKGKKEALTLPEFLVSKGFTRVVHKMPPEMQPYARPAHEKTGSLVNVYEMTPGNFSAAQIAKLAKDNEILIVAPNRQVLPALLREARAQNVPFATLSDLRTE